MIKVYVPSALSYRTEKSGYKVPLTRHGVTFSDIGLDQASLHRSSG